MRIWACKIGECEFDRDGADFPMRRAVECAYREVTGQDPTFIFSGWGATLTEGQRACVEDLLPNSSEGVK